MKSSLWCDDEDDVRSNSALGKKCKDSFPLVKSIDAFPKARDASSKKAQGWVSPSFGDFRTDAQSSVSRKRSRDGNRKTDHKSITVGRRDVDDTMLWSDKYKPTNKDDLAVHKKKVAEVEDWLLQQFGHASRKGAGILLLAGPAGAGKSTSVRLLASELRMEVQEWINPPTSTYRPEWTPHSSDFTEYGESQATQFREFLLRANKYPALQMLGSVASERKIVLVEDFPNAFFRDSSNFHRILSKYGSTAQSPLVFIVSDSQGGESNVQKLFPRNAQADLGIHCISFNPVAATSMLKVLARVAAEEAAQGRHDFPAPSADVMSALADGSSGDLRGALNALQFACLRDTCDLAGGAGDGSGRRTEPSRRAAKSRTAGRRRRKEAVHAVGGGEEEAEAGGSIGCRDTTLFLFRALGKVLYCKREPPDGDTEQEVLPPHLAHHARRRLQCVPEEVLEKSHMSPDFFNLYLHHNYLSFCGSITDAVAASDYFSHADILTGDWANQSTLSKYAGCLGTRGLMHSNVTETQSRGWKPLHKPQWYAVQKKARESMQEARHLFRSHCWTPEDLVTQLIPYLCLVNAPLRSPDQFALLQDLSRFPRSTGQSRATSEMLGERDDCLLDAAAAMTPADTRASERRADEDATSCSQENLGGGGGGEEEGEEEEGYVIEDYDE